MSVLLEINDLYKNFSGIEVIRGFNLSLNERTLSCLVGPNGAGKTTTIDLITGRLKPTSGTISFKYDEGNESKRDITGMSESQIAHMGISRKFQVPAVFKELSVRQNLEVAFSNEVSPFKNMINFSSTDLNVRLDEVLELTGLGGRLEIVAGTLSHGETQWLEIGMVLMKKPRLILFDEPVAGMTEGEVGKTVQMLNELKKTVTLMVVEHDMGFVRDIADIVTVMHMGTLLAQGSIKEIEKDKAVREVYLGTED
ncbi:ATP-binding cassette domain-containing protein [Paracoccaceae bacterium]|jgi:urea transport system ATP-binding protein|nr:ATP-binding cassette domain-containing protein [Paracoccaceae bacterium]